ncbi:MAG TPA: gamma-glutamyltransferase [Acidiferrobacteraceae bacterium]|nr:gamma-glutamyltransferase [Acidiferrobacteraceae bacterium]
MGLLHGDRTTAAVVVAPEGRAAEAAAAVLAEGGHAVEAMVCAAAVIGVTYPHMCGLGGDGFWLVHEPGRSPWGINAAGPAGHGVTHEWYAVRGLGAVPARGPSAAITMAGAVSGWAQALRRTRHWGPQLPLARLLEPAAQYAQGPAAKAGSVVRACRAPDAPLQQQPGFGATYGAEEPSLCQPALAHTLRQLARAGLDDFYRGAVARALAADLGALGSPLAYADFAQYAAVTCEPWALRHTAGMLYNLPPPTQGVVSLAILGILDRLAWGYDGLDHAEGIHAVVEATKQAFVLRERGLRTGFGAGTLAPDVLAAAAQSIAPDRAAPWGGIGRPGGTVWMGIVDHCGRAVSYIQSLYHEFGSGVLLPQTGVLWHNRGHAFSLSPQDHPWSLAPGRIPWHTLNPALARLHDGSVLVYGAMGGDGQGQTQAALFTRMVQFGATAADAVGAPRWLLGRTWGRMSDTLKLEHRFHPQVFQGLRERGHVVETVSAFDEAMGHAGLIRRYRDGTVAAASDPRSDGAAIEVPGRT